MKANEYLLESSSSLVSIASIPDQIAFLVFAPDQFKRMLLRSSTVSIKSKFEYETVSVHNLSWWMVYMVGKAIKLAFQRIQPFDFCTYQ